MRKNQPIKPTYYFDTPKGIDEFTKALYEDGNMTEDEFKKMNRDTKVAMLKDEYSKLKPYRADDPSSYPSNEEQRQRLFNISNLEKVTNILFSNKRKMINKGLRKILPDAKIELISDMRLDQRPANIKPEIYYKITELYEKS